MNIISNDDEGSPRGSNDAGGNQYPALVLCPEGLLLDLIGLNYSKTTLFFIYSAIVSSFWVFFTSISTFYSRCSTFSMFSFIMP
jgi:hypothetical protein